jgi:LuxR family transcriptional regulator, maltose regulon positive regulatory protein
MMVPPSDTAGIFILPSGLPTEPEALEQSTLRIVAEMMTLLERNPQDGQVLVRQVATHLQQQSDALRNCSQSILNLLPASASSALPLAELTDPDHLRLRCFGRFEVIRGGESIPLRRAGKASAILKFLALNPHQPVPRDVLVEAVWPETDPAIANNRLKVAMHHLRQTFVTKGCSPHCEGCVVFRDGCYLFNPGIGVWTDVQAFEQAWQKGQGLARDGRAAEAITFYLQAASLYRGDLFEQDPYDEWTLIRRAELRDTFLSILDKVSRYWLQIGRLDDAIEGWTKILVKDPWREDIYRRLMVCNVQRGQRGLALRWFETCTRALETQLNVGPEPETVALHRRILAGEQVSEWMGTSQ